METKIFKMLVLFAAFAVQGVFAQSTKTVSGTVSDDTGPLPGVDVRIKGTTRGTETDFDGKYSIQVSKGQTLQFSYIGMKSNEQVVDDIAKIDVVLEQDAEALDEVVVTAFGIKRQAKSLGYAAVKVASEDITRTSVANPLETLSGKVPGVNITAPNQPGASTTVTFRGIGSITGSNAPLYVVDGSPINNAARGTTGFSSSFDGGNGINDLDPNTIESINFLKGASATALYGSRAGNGVIIINTKKGKNKLKVDISSSFDASEVSRVPHIQKTFGTGWSAHSYSNVFGEGSKAASNENGSWGPKFNGEVRPWSRIVDEQQLIKPYVVLEDNMIDFFNSGTTLNNSVTLSGGSDKSDFAVTYSNFDTDGVIPTDRDSFEKNSFGINGGIKSDKWTIRTSVNYVNKRQTAVTSGQGDDATYGKSMIQEILQMPNDVSIVDMRDTENKFYTASNFYTPYAANPYLSLENNNVALDKDRFFGNANVSYNFTDNFSASYQISTDVDTETVKRYGAIVEYAPGSPQDNASANGVVGAVSEAKYTTRQTDHNFIVNYNAHVNEDFHIDVMGGINYNERNENFLEVEVKDLDLENYYELSNSATTPVVTQSDLMKRYIGVYAQAVVDYKEKYFLTLTGRNDWSSALPDGNNAYFYPSVSFAGILSESSDFFAKLRAGYAKIGNDTDAYLVHSEAGQASNAGYFGELSYPFAEVNGNEIYGRIANENLKPETIDEIEFGFETRMLENRVGLDVSFYRRKTTDLILDLPVARSTGYANMTSNAADMTNKGVELLLNVKPIRTEDFTWEMNYTFSKNDNNVDKINNEEGKVIIESAYGTFMYAEEGKPFGAFYSPGIAYTDAGEVIADPSNGYYYDDGVSKYNGSAQENFIAGLQNNLKYKDFKLSFGLDWKQGGKMYSYTKRLSHFVGNGIETTYNDRNPWIIPNSVVRDLDADGNFLGTYSENTTPVAFEDVTAFYNTSQNAAIEQTHIIDKTFVRLRDVSLSYTFPESVTDKLSLNRLSLSIYGRNLFLWTPGDNPYSDPETSNFNDVATTRLFGEFATNPAQRTYGANLQLSF